jgi:predicted ferric reductase
LIRRIQNTIAPLYLHYIYPVSGLDVRVLFKMDMSMPMDPTVANLSLSDPKCVKAAEACLEFYAAENASQAAIPWASLFEYGHWATYYYVIIIGVLFVVHVYNIVKDRRASSTTQQKPNAMRRLQAAGRSIFYRRLPPRGAVRFLDASPNIGTLSFLLVTLIFLIGLTFSARPYYRQHLGFGSPPIAIKSGLMAFACVPILVALSGKANIVTLFTGISHERLNVVHRWVACMSFGLSLIHAIPYFVASYRDFGNGGMTRVKSEFYYSMSGAGEVCLILLPLKYDPCTNEDGKFTGTPPLAILFGLCVLSLPQIRHRFYESFYAVHIVMAITYLGLLFWHSENLMDSWVYLWATVAIWLASWLARMFWKTQPLNIRNRWFVGAPATLTVLPGDVTRIDVWQDRGFNWTPSAHVFLRFTEVAPLDNHPFTIASAPSSPGSTQSHLIFLARSHAGFTQKLAAHVNAKAGKEDGVTTTVWVDGPYGGIHRPLLTRYDSLILVAGGTGITACLPWLLHAVAQARAESPRLKRVVLVWAMRSADALSWLADEFDSVAGKESGIDVALKFHVTGSSASIASSQVSAGVVDTKTETKVASIPADQIANELKGGSVDSTYEDRLTALGTVVSGRPVMSAVIREHVKASEQTMVFGCGPDGFRADLANAVAGAQKRVLKGECVEIGMHLETFGW